jgi:hypothetical protein
MISPKGHENPVFQPLGDFVTLFVIVFKISNTIGRKYAR